MDKEEYAFKKLCKSNLRFYLGGAIFFSIVTSFFLWVIFFKSPSLISIILSSFGALLAAFIAFGFFIMYFDQSSALKEYYGDNWKK